MAQKENEKLHLIRRLMEGNYDVYIITSVDRHNSEYVHERDKLIAYISNFTGSYGIAIITKTQALLWTDGRYYDQATNELDKGWTLMRERSIGVPFPIDWLVANCEKNQIVATDPYLMSYSQWSQFQLKLTPLNIKLVAAKINLVYEIWVDKPSESRKPIFAHPIKFTGKTAGEKIQYCREQMKKAQVTVLVVSALDEVAYLLNLRGSDISYNPVFYSYVIIEMEVVHFFVDKERLTDEAVEQLQNEDVHLTYHPYNDVLPVLKQILNSGCEHIWISSSSSAVFRLECSNIKVKSSVTPICLMKVVKNNVEIEGMKLAHIKDAVALVKYFAWLEDKIKKGEFVTEISGAEKLEEYRREQENFVQLSFTTISSFGEHGAIIHYAPEPQTDKQITNKELYLCDSGAQFLEGTTDVTRTMHFGTPTDYEKECFTRVFKGQANLSRAIFPPLIIGNYLDTLARKSLWDVGLNYAHGTGHGIGSYLNVHEFPVMISFKEYPEDPGMQEGVFISNEPGYYESGKFGIRLENIEQVVKADTKYSFNNVQFLKFETVTLVPIQVKMLDTRILSDDEIDYLNKYHQKCLNILRPLLQEPKDVQALRWLEKETKPIQRSI